MKFSKAQLKAEKSYERPLALFNGFNARDGVFIKFKKGVKKDLHIIYEGKTKKIVVSEIYLIWRKIQK